MSIGSFADRATQQLFLRGITRANVGWKSIGKIVRRKLDMLDYAVRISDLRSPPGSRLEALRGSLEGFFSIRVNDKWRIVFRWTVAGPTDVGACDYH